LGLLQVLAMPSNFIDGSLTKQCKFPTETNKIGLKLIKMNLTTDCHKRGEEG